ncbi:P1 family peptidase [Nocardioides sp. HDW12B]|uniref:P1 family peptidase n=1 Tax=Nocardioides sp. HDW12B TaxID=2714939 RepID=UPI001409E0EF|nr:P1 family peptidase [Nocardioides sp. HDW12B]QIK67026.1 P1 family peptidase [Nocardioides sp. HDW12B]
MSALTDVPGVRVGHWTDTEARTGCTVVLLPDDGATTSIDVRGAAPGTRETDLLRPEATVPRAHAIVLTGGSAFGLAAADGVMRHLESRRIGTPTPAGPVPIVPAAVLYDLAVGSASVRPDAEAGLAAVLDAERGLPCTTGVVGAGAGATVGKLFGAPVAGGLGTASVVLPSGAVVGALAAVNAVGDVVAEDGSVLAGATSPGTVTRLLAGEAPGPPPPGTSTTLAVVATDAALTKTQCHRLAQVAHDAFAQAIRPVHTGFDGDTVFAVSTGVGEPLDDAAFLVVQVAAVETVARAIRSAVTTA